jgi:hypothetical protein
VPRTSSFTGNDTRLRQSLDNGIQMIKEIKGASYPRLAHLEEDYLTHEQSEGQDVSNKIDNKYVLVGLYDDYTGLNQTDTGRPNIFPEPEPASDTMHFIKQHQLEEDLIWLRNIVPTFFKDSFFEIKLLSGHDDEDDFILDLRVYNPYPLLVFLEQMHGFYDLMLFEGRIKLYHLLGVTHWRRHYFGLQAFPGYSAISS